MTISLGGISGDFSTAPAINSYNDYLIPSHWGKREHHLIIIIFVTCVFALPCHEGEDSDLFGFTEHIINVAF